MFQNMTVIGENLNATRKVKADGKMVVDLGGGRKGYPYKALDGQDKFLDLTEALKSQTVQNSGMVGYIAAGIVARDEEFIAAIAGRQVARGADILDCCVDEISPWQKDRLEHMKWLVRTVQKHVKAPVSFDSSDPDCLRAGLEVYDKAAGRPLLNSVNLEPNRLPILKIAQEAGACVLGNASGREALPTDVEERVGNLGQLMAMMDEHQIPMENRMLDPLVLPIGTNPEYGQFFLESCRILREKYGSEFHLTGGFSNVSFGLPNRKLLNNAMTYLAREAGCDTAFIDPAQIGDFRPEGEGFQKAVAALKGQDMYCIEYINYCRSM
ncbi:MAG: dihydropteroate synthase [bacterium]|nr:dihydropteroate synthase [bacterium]